MEHNDIRHRLSEYIDGSVTGDERAAIEAHLKTCMQCSSALEELRKTIEHIKTIEELDPPAWMTQKIMATVRAEAEEKKGLFHRFFFPLRVKIPIQAIAVLFLAVTGVYIYQNMQPAEKVSEAPMHELATRNETPPVGAEQDKLARTDSPAARSKQAPQVPQAPEYRSLDMKQEYEAPPLPVPAGKAAEPAATSGLGGQPAPARNEAALDESPAAPHVAPHQATAPQAAAPAVPQKKTGRSVETAMQAEGKQESAAEQQKSLKGTSSIDGSSSAINITISVKNIETATTDTEATIKEFHGTIMETQRLDAKRIYILSLDTSHANDLVEKLKRMGAMKEKNLVLEPGESRMVFRIELNMRREGKAAVGC